MNKSLRQQVYDKFGGRCAYTGRILGDDWQVDHMISKMLYIYHVIKDYPQDITPKIWHEKVEELKKAGVNCIDNLLPALRIVNHYKRDLDLEGFRNYMLTFHQRLAKLPKNPYSLTSIKRKKYMLEVADVFGITQEKPFTGKFYFETINN